MTLLEAAKAVVSDSSREPSYDDGRPTGLDIVDSTLISALRAAIAGEEARLLSELESNPIHADLKAFMSDEEE